jgi:hypothetical protein
MYQRLSFFLTLRNRAAAAHSLARAILDVLGLAVELRKAECKNTRSRIPGARFTV